jgi:hypothetical protein
MLVPSMNDIFVLQVSEGATQLSQFQTARVGYAKNQQPDETQKYRDM